MAIKFVDEELCDGCGICVDECPADVLRLRKPERAWEKTGWTAYIQYPSDCHSCTFCELACPQKAIQVSCSLIIPPDCFPDRL